MPHPIHHVEMICERCEVRVKLNDMPLLRLVGSGDEAEWFAPPCNPYLVGSNNMVEVEVHPLRDENGEPSDLGEAVVELAVRRYAAGEPVAPGVGDALLEMKVHDELKERIREAAEEEEELELPQVFFYMFDNEGPSFAAELHDAEPFDDQEAVRDYAIALRDMAGARDAAGLLAEMEPKVQAYMAAYDHPRDPLVASLDEGLKEILAVGVRTDFERAEVELEACCGGRVWAVRRPGHEPLLATEPDDDGNTMQIEVIVGPREGALKIVR